MQLLWNTSASAPTGLYFTMAGYPSCGSLAVVRLPHRVRLFAADRGYLPMSSVMIKPVAGRSGSTVCRHGRRVSIDGRVAVLAKSSDAAGRPLPRWQGCYRLDSGKIFVLSPRSDSFDSRYFGPIDRRYVEGLAFPVALAGTASYALPTSWCEPREGPASPA